MIVQVRAFANFRDILGKELKVELKECSSVEDLLDDLISTKDRLKPAIFDESGKVKVCHHNEEPKEHRNPRGT